jgi:hypothetical protein
LAPLVFLLNSAPTCRNHVTRFALSKGTTLVTTAILARLLTRSDFGVVVFAVTVVSFLDAVRDLAMEASLIQRRHNVEQAADTNSERFELAARAGGRIADTR